MVVTLPSHANEMECRAVRKCCESAGAREVHIIPTPVAAAVGAGLPIEEPAGHMIVDVGGGSTTISIVSLKGIVHSVTCPGGGEGIDRDILNHLREQHGLLVGLTTVEQLKWQIAGNASDTHSDSRPVKGRCMKSGVPKAVNVTRSEILTAIHGSIENIGTHILRTLESSPPELASDVVDHGAILVGGGSRLSGLEGHLRNQTSLTIVRAEEPETAAVMGAGTILEDHELLHSIQFG
jgi:rod shape-determining protein MreB